MEHRNKDEQIQGLITITSRKWNYLENKFNPKRSIRVTKNQKDKLASIHKLYNNKIPRKIIVFGMPIYENPKKHHKHEILYLLCEVYKFFHPLMTIDDMEFRGHGVSDKYIRKVIDWCPDSSNFFEKIQGLWLNKESVIKENIDKSRKERESAEEGLFKAMNLGSKLDWTNEEYAKKDQTIHGKINQAKDLIKYCKQDIIDSLIRIDADKVQIKHNLENLKKLRKEVEKKKTKSSS